nr:hypothetical protein Itr_chr09CG10610 [Ipomoea trifida]
MASTVRFPVGARDMGAIMKVFGVFTRPPSAQASVGAEKKHELARFLGSLLRKGVRIWRRSKLTKPLILPPGWVVATPARPSWSPGDRVSHIKLIVVFTWMAGCHFLSLLRKQGCR